ncbi:MAG: 2TM domain-containing protein [Chloroflexota bacterium]|nr:2TM domain-containing protein [Chloroflexota bacterium]MDE2908425.1 2TM domain-containing protein [Chloroflexota bacterium]
MEKRKNQTQLEIEIRRRVEAKYDERNALLIHLISYAGVNILVWLIWLFSSGGFPWPLFVSFFWGIGMAGHLLDYYNKHGGGARKREERIQEEVLQQMRRLEERERGIYADENADVYALDDVELRHVRLTDDGELTDYQPMDEDDAQEQRRQER